MFTYNSRSTQFVNLEHEIDVHIPKNLFTGVCDRRDCLFGLFIAVKSDSKTMVRTRRKFWDDVSLRGG